MPAPKYLAPRRPSLTQGVTMLSSSNASGWRGFELHETTVNGEGKFDARLSALHIRQLFGTSRARFSGTKQFHDVPTSPKVILPREGRAGVWEGLYRGIHLFIDPEAVERLIHQPFREEIFLRKCPAPALSQLLQALLIDVRHGHPSGPLLGETIISALLHQLLADSQRAHKHGILGRGDLTRVREWIETHLAQAFSLEELAAEAGVSVRHLHRAFITETGLSPYRYILARRIERAKDLIQTGKLNLAEVASATGFCDQAHMANTFRKVLGLSPSQFSNTKW